MPCRRMNLSSVIGPPWSGGGGPRRPSVISEGGGPAISWMAASTLGRIIFRGGRGPESRHILSYHSRPVPPLPTTAAELAARLLAGEKRALARAISLVENDDPEGWALVREVFPKTGRAAVVGFTGPPGVGKSTLIGTLVKSARS